MNISNIADPAHVSDVMYVFRFIQVTKPIISSRIIRFQVEQTNITIFMFILNISVEQTKLQYNGGSISNRNLTITLSIDIYDSGPRKAIHPSSALNPGRFAHFPVRPWVVSPTFPFAPSRFAPGSFRPLSRSPLSRLAHFPVRPRVVFPPYKILFLVLLFRPQKWYKALIFLLIGDFSL